MAVENGHLEVVDLLLSKGAKVDEVSKFMRYMHTTTLRHVASYIVNKVIFNDNILKSADSEIIFIICTTSIGNFPIILIIILNIV